MEETGAARIAKGYDVIARVCLIVFAFPLTSLIVLASTSSLFQSFWTGVGCGIIAGIVSGLGLYCMFGFVHDGSHGNIPKSSRVAKYVNFLVMPLMGVSTFTYRKAHLAHHSHLGQSDKDPQYAPFDEGATKTVPICWSTEARWSSTPPSATSSTFSRRSAGSCKTERRPC